jgi:hypothetical protein
MSGERGKWGVEDRFLILLLPDKGTVKGEYRIRVNITFDTPFKNTKYRE